MIHLDTSFLIRGLMDGTPEARQLDQWCARAEPIAMCALAWAEFLCGPVGTQEREIALEFLGEILDMGVAEAGRAATLFHFGGRRARSLADCVIGACAIEAGAALATSNVGDFRRFVPIGLQLTA